MMILIGTMPRAESGDERRDCVTLWAVQLRRASAVAESTLGVTLTGMTATSADIFAGSLPAGPMRGGTAGAAAGARGRGQRTRVCGWCYTARFAHRVKSGGGMRMFKFSTIQSGRAAAPDIIH